jgi:hypothetical protein
VFCGPVLLHLHTPAASGSWSVCCHHNRLLKVLLLTLNLLAASDIFLELEDLKNTIASLIIDRGYSDRDIACKRVLLISCEGVHELEICMSQRRLLTKIEKEVVSIISIVYYNYYSRYIS